RAGFRARAVFPPFPIATLLPSPSARARIPAIRSGAVRGFLRGQPKLFDTTGPGPPVPSAGNIPATTPARAGDCQKPSDRSMRIQLPQSGAQIFQCAAADPFLGFTIYD